MAVDAEGSAARRGHRRAGAPGAAVGVRPLAGLSPGSPELSASTVRRSRTRRPSGRAHLYWLSALSRRSDHRRRAGRPASGAGRRADRRDRGDHLQGPSGALALGGRRRRHQRRAESRGHLGVARVRHDQGVGLPGRPGRDRDHVPRGPGRDPVAGARRRHLPPQRARQPRHARLRRRLGGAHLLRRRHHRPRHPARPLRAADEARVHRRPLRGVVRDRPAPGRRRPLHRRGLPQPARRAAGGVQRQEHDPRQRRRRPGLQADDQRADRDRRRHRPGLPDRRPADGHGDDPVPPDDAGRATGC